MSADAGGPSSRAQANLAAFAIAVLVVTTTTTLAIFVADGAFAAADESSLEHARAEGLAAVMVGAESPLTTRANVVNATAAGALDTNLEDWFPATIGVDVRVSLEGATIAERGDPTHGTTVRRLVLVADADPRTVQPALTSSDRTVTLPRRASSIDLTISPPGGTTVTTVRANERVVLHEPGGLDGTYTIEVSRFETTTLAFDATGALPPGSVELRYRPATTRKAILEVTVDA